MFLQIDMIDSQIVTDGPDGSVEIHGQSGYIHLRAEYAKRVRIHTRNCSKPIRPRIV